MVQPLLTLVAAVLSIVAVGLIPGSKAIDDGETGRYKSWGKGAVYFLAMVMIGVGGYIIYDWYPTKEWDLITIGNMALFAALGIGLIANNAWVSRQIVKVEEKEVEAEIIEVEAIEVDDLSADGLMEEKDVRPTRPVKKTPKKVKRVRPKTVKKKVKKPTVKKMVKPKKSVKKKAKPKKSVKKPEPEPKEELIPDDDPAPTPRKATCPSCDTPVDHHDDTCPVCGEDIRG